MSWFGSDVVAIGCILGGAAVGGAATLAVMDGGEQVDGRCGIERMAVSPTIAVSGQGGAHAIVVGPDVRVHSVRDCGSSIHEVVEIHMDNQLRHLDAQLEHLDHVLEIELEGLEAQIEAEVEAELVQLEAELELQEAIRAFEDAKVKMVIEKVGGGGR
ncbi:MAG: hypothetical protein HKO65_06225 [Gemmatimonadetes bacterium]|nr:hypothetical protein [Gemmatimonadota bacterium]